MHSLQVENGLSVAHNEEKVKDVSYVLMSKVDVFMPTHEKRTFAVSQLNAVELARTLSWRENALFEEREKNNQLVHLSTCLVVNLSTHHTLSTFQQEI